MALIMIKISNIIIIIIIIKIGLTLKQIIK